MELKLITEDNSQALKRNSDYYQVSKEVWYFFFNIYGGGPTIVTNNQNIPDNISEGTSNRFEIMSYNGSSVNGSAYKSDNTAVTAASSHKNL